MDALPSDIAAILAYNETGAQFFKRMQHERVLTGLPIIDNNLSLRPGVVLEVAGPPGSGKTELLLSIALHVLLAPYAEPDAWLPSATATACVGAPRGYGPGPSQPGPVAPAAPPQVRRPHKLHKPHVVILDLDGKFDGVRLMQVLEPQVQSAWRDQQQHRLAVRQEKLQQQHQQQQQLQTALMHQRASDPGQQPGAEANDSMMVRQLDGTASAAASLTSPSVPEQLLSPDQVVAEVLSRLYVVRCHSSLQVLATLVALPARLEAMQADGGSCRLLLVDNVGSHYWRDRAARNVSAPGGSHVQHHTMPSQQQQPLALSLFEMHAAIAGQLVHLSRRLRLPVVVSKRAAVTARALEGEPGERGGGAPTWSGDGPVQLQQREFMPMPWQNVVTHRLLLFPRGVVPGPAPPTSAASQRPAPTLTAILAEMLGPIGPPGYGPGAGVGGHGVVAGGGGAAGGSGHVPGRKVAQLLVSAVAMVEEW